MKHLSAESALYCRIFIEGLLGIEPISFSKVKMTPKLPKEHDELMLSNIYLSGIRADIIITRKGERLNVLVKSEDAILFNGDVNKEQSILIDLQKD